MIAAAVAASFALTATPARVQLTGAQNAALRVRNRGTSRVVVDVQRAGFALDLRGRPRIVPVRPSAWLTVTPRRVAVAAGGVATLTVRGRVPHGAAPGDRTGLLLLSTEPPSDASVAVRLRLGIVVVLRVPGTVLHRLAVQGLGVGRSAGLRTFRLSLANTGNVTELLTARRVVVTFRRGRKVFARLHPAARELLPRSRAVLELRWRTAVRGALTADVSIAPVAGAGGARRTFEVSLE